MQLDYEKMIEALSKRVKEYMDVEDRYFALARKLNELKPYIEQCGERIMEMKMTDQLKLFEIMVVLAELEKNLCEKYGWADDIDIVPMD